MARGWKVEDLPAHLRAQAIAQLNPSPKRRGEEKCLLEGAETVPPAKGEGRRRSKYNNEPQFLDGFRFDSKRETARYQYLKSLQAIGTIAGLQLQVPFALMVNGICVAEYVADFTYRIVDENRMVIEDVKGKKTDVYLLKRKIMDALGHHIHEVVLADAPAGWDERKKAKRE